MILNISNEVYSEGKSDKCDSVGSDDTDLIFFSCERTLRSCKELLINLRDNIWRGFKTEGQVSVAARGGYVPD